MSNITATRDLAVIAIIAYAYYKLKNPLADATQAAADARKRAAQQVQQTIHFYGSGGELKKAIDEAKTEPDKSRGGVADQAGHTWTKYMQSVFGKGTPDVVFTAKKEIMSFDEWKASGMPQFVVDQGTTVTQPDTTDAPMTQEQRDRAIAAALRQDAQRDQPIQIFENMNIQQPTPQPRQQQPQPQQMSIAPSLRQQPQFTGGPVSFLPPAPTPQRQPATETRPLDSMSREQAAAEGWTYSGCVGYFR